MATGKRYFWFKLRESFMTSDTVDFLMSQKDGANYVVLYQMLCLKTINTGGRLSRQIGEHLIPYDVDKIQRDCKWFTADTVRVALNLYKSLGLVYEDVDGTLVLVDHGNIVGSETDWAKQKRLQKSAQLLPPSESGNSVESGVENFHTDIDIRDKRLDIDTTEDNTVLNKNIEYKIIGCEGEKKRKRFTPPTPEEVEAYAQERGYLNFNARRFVDFYESKGWMVGKNRMKDWKAAVRGWAARDDGAGATNQHPANPAMNYEQREYKDEDFGEGFYIDLDQYGGE